MKFEQWIRKSWYVPLIVVFFATAVIQFIGDSYGISFFAKFSAVVGILIALPISYFIYKAQYTE
jgi:F0F1-type ATP synthase assembly protein I